MAVKLNKMREEIVERFISALSENQIPWQKAWRGCGIPKNAISDKPYTGVNNFSLQLTALEKGYTDNRWCTFNQAKDRGYKIKEGEHGSKIEYWGFFDKEKKENILPKDLRKRIAEIEAEGKDWREIVKPVSKIYYVFNVEQMDGVKTVEQVILPKNDDLVSNRDKLIAALEVGFKEGGNSACYVPSQDEIRMPLWEDFKSEYGYMATFLHEAAHSTGSSKRLNRNIENTFGSPDYAKEELRAEITSAFLAQQLGFGSADRLDNHSAYIQSWIDVLENNPNELFAAIKEAEAIADYLIEKGELEKAKTELIELQEEINEERHREKGKVKDDI